MTIEAEAYRSADDDQRLYRPFSAALRKVRIKAIPYYAWNNRGVGEMLVWIRQGYC